MANVNMPVIEYIWSQPLTCLLGLRCFNTSANAHVKRNVCNLIEISSGLDAISCISALFKVMAVRRAKPSHNVIQFVDANMRHWSLLSQSRTHEIKRANQDVWMLIHFKGKIISTKLIAEWRFRSWKSTSLKIATFFLAVTYWKTP